MPKKLSANFENLTKGEVTLLFATLNEMKARGIDIRQEFKRTNTNVMDEGWGKDEGGWFINRSGRKFTPNSRQQEFIESNARYVALISGRGGGKALAVDTPILTEVGWKTMGTIEVGDKVYGTNGKFCNVTDVSRIYNNHKCFRIFFLDGSNIVADSEHLWTIQYSGFTETFTTARLAELFFTAGYSPHLPPHRKPNTSFISSVSIKKFRRNRSVPVRCITVDSPDHLFLVGKSCIPTHNSASGAQKALRKIEQGQNGLILNPDFENFRLSTWSEFRDWVPWGKVVESQRHMQNLEWRPHQPFELVFVNGATVYCKGLRDPDSARGPNVNWLWYDEGGRDDTGMGWRIANASVRIGNLPQAWVTATPRGKTHWMYKFFVKKEIPSNVKKLMEKLSEKREMIHLVFTSIEENKDNLSEDFYLSMMLNYSSGWLRDQELDGKFVDEGGNLGNSGWFSNRIVDAVPEDFHKVIRYWDLAASEKKLVKRSGEKDPDHTVGTKLAQAKVTNNFYILNQVSGQMSWAQIKQLIVDTARLDGETVPIYIEQEPASGGINQVAEIASLPELANFIVRKHNPRDFGDKVMRAMAWFSKAEMGLIFLRKGNWNEDFLDQLGGFPNGEHDDLIDSVSGAFAVLAPPRKWSKTQFVAIG